MRSERQGHRAHICAHIHRGACRISSKGTRAFIYLFIFGGGVSGCKQFILATFSLNKKEILKVSRPNLFI